MDRKHELFRIAAELATGKSMPSTEREDWNFPKYISSKQKCRIIGASYLANFQCKEWAIRIRKIADTL